MPMVYAILYKYTRKGFINDGCVNCFRCCWRVSDLGRASTKDLYSVTNIQKLSLTPDHHHHEAEIIAMALIIYAA